ncbi:hypothetical protein F1559_004473 [Cyanidiococcus yangmingshanensis]|uniref:thiamine phosphate synthase n=1 Tax=Cyanidiococcus yangmingshanensis TaxID=2690220 RepID=A0A7J7IPA7_9RHOD|nr:hypothetical protein F1559_004473 [Cyanidiococcus yangmingshanensis]
MASVREHASRVKDLNSKRSVDSTVLVSFVALSWCCASASNTRSVGFFQARSRAPGVLAQHSRPRLPAWCSLRCTSFPVTSDQSACFRPGRLDLSLYLIADRGFVSRLGSRRSLEELVERALSSECISVVQLRDKISGLRPALAVGKRLRAMCQSARVPFLVNDRLDLALALEADGIHIGQEDMPLAYVQKLAPAGWILGASAGTLSKVEILKQESSIDRPIRLDYIGCGPVFGTQTKADAGSPIGAAGLTRVAESVEPLPVVAVGGIGLSNAKSCIAHGRASGIACISAILGADDPKLAARALHEQIKQGREMRVRGMPCRGDERLL